MIAHQRKRARSPSPDFDHLASPLDGLLKRRRQQGTSYGEDANDYISYAPQHSSPYDPYSLIPENGGGGESSNAPWPRFVEKRRTRQWEKLNAPQYHQHSHGINGASSSQPHNYPLDNSSPLRPKSLSQPGPGPSTMSSSPVRHEPPPSSPFKAIQRGASEEEEDEMGEEELKKEWGAEYYAQNSLLHSLHMTRATQHDPSPSQVISTPDYSMLQTPGASASSASYFPEPQYRNTAFPPSSSPFPSQLYTAYSSNTEHTPDNRGQGAMEVDMTPDRGRHEAEVEVRRRYEETNRLLAELEVVRRQRWGEGS